jgi:bifunctional UDP-N-acetylglucosamine pyrophosphorylase/glucosamine-1-phosphate N-acetyltransferase
VSQNQTNTEWVAIVLAAGQGTRMKSPLPKVLHEIAGRPLVAWSIAAALDAGVQRCVAVVGHGREQVESTLHTRFGGRVSTALQAEQRGTGHAVRCAMESPALATFEGNVVILYGDCPLIPKESVHALINALDADASLAMLTSHLPDPRGYGRILRDAEGRVRAIREQRDCSPGEAAVREVNPGLYAVRAGFLRDAIARLSDDNAQGELYLTDVVEQAAAAGGVRDVAWDMADLRGVNDRYELALCAEERRLRIAAALARDGVAVRDLRTVYVDADCEVAPGAVLEAQVHLRGRCVIETGARIDVGAVLTDVIVREGAEVLPYTVASESVIGEEATVGPFTHLRPHRAGPRVQGGELLRDQEDQAGRGLEGEPPELRGRRCHRQEREHRRRHHLLQLRRRAEAHHHARGQRLHRQRQPAGGAGHRGRGGLCGQRDHRDAGRPARRAGRGAHPPAEQRRLRRTLPSPREDAREAD